jgi:hypothetical protein
MQEKKELEQRLHEDSNLLVTSLKAALRTIEDRQSSPIYRKMPRS